MCERCPRERSERGLGRARLCRRTERAASRERSDPRAARPDRRKRLGQASGVLANEASEVSREHRPIAGSCIEGIGPDLAATLYEAYPTVAELVAADREVLTDTSGIGEKRARTVLAALRDRPIAD